jgi:hypothetical protein
LASILFPCIQRICFLTLGKVDVFHDILGLVEMLSGLFDLWIFDWHESLLGVVFNVQMRFGFPLAAAFNE